MSKSVRALAFALAALVVPVVGHSQPLDFKGIVIGTPTTREALRKSMAEAALEGFVPSDCTNRIESAGGGFVCSVGTSIAGAFAHAQVVVGREGVIDEIIVGFSSDDYETVKSALAKKFGMPARAGTTLLQNRMGAVFENEMLGWDGDAGSEMLLTRFSDKLTLTSDEILSNSTLELMSSAVADAADQAQKAKENDL